MNGYQRINAVLNGQWPDKRPVMLHNFLMAIHEAGVSHAQYRSDPEIVAKVHIAAAEKYGVDGVMIDVDTVTLAEAVGVPVDSPNDDPARSHEACLTSIEQVDGLEPVDLSKNERVQVWLEGVRLVKEYFGDEKFVRGNCDQAPFSLASMMRTPSEWMMDLVMEENHERVFKLLDYCTDVTSQFIRLMAKTGADMVSNGDSPAGPAMISPAMYREFALPSEKKVVEIAHECGLPYMLHICGDTTSILEAMKESGTDSIELDYGTDIQAVHDVFGNDVVFSGCIDPSGVLLQGTPELVATKAQEVLDIYADSPAYIINAGCAVPALTPEENLRALVKTAHNAEINPREAGGKHEVGARRKLV